MKSFRTPRYLERYEDVVFELENQLEIDPNDTQHQNRDGLKFVADNSGETTPFDWYNARLSVNFKVDKLADHAAIAVDDNIGTFNGSNTLIKKIQVRAEGREVYDCDYANHCVNIKHLLEYNPSYAKSVGTNEYYFPDTSRHPDSNKFTERRVTHRRNADNTGDDAGNMIDAINPNYNKGFAARKVLLGASDEVNCEIPLNRYSFFEELQDRLLPNVRIELQIEVENDKNLNWRTRAADAAGTTYRLIVTKIQLFVPRMIFNAEGQKLYLENYLKPHKWTYLTETTYSQNMRDQLMGAFRLTNGIPKPRHVFIFFVNNASLDNQLLNPFLYNTLYVSTNSRTLEDCYLEVGNGNEYPHLKYEPNRDLSRVFRDVMKYANANNDFQGGTLLDISNFKNLYPFIYFDLTKQKTDLRDGNTKLTFHYKLNDNTATHYTIFGIVLSEKDAEIDKESGKLLLRG